MRARLRNHRVLADLMSALEVTDRELAEEAGYRSKTHIVRMRRGETPGCGLDYAVRIARRLGVGVNELFVPDASGKSGQIGEAA